MNDQVAEQLTARMDDGAAGAPAALLQVDRVTHVYGAGRTAVTALDAINLTIGSGEIVCIVGPSGCGKTTLLRCVAGLARPTAGSVRLSGRPVSGVPDGLAIVFQDYSRSLFPWMTVARNVEFPLVKRLSQTERQVRSRDSLEAVGLLAVADRYPWQLSGGMQQRVAIARALAYRPRILLMDEPFASVDAQTREELEDLLLGLRDRFGFTVLFVTHDIDESVYLASRVVVLSKTPARVLKEIPIDLPLPRDQIVTRGLDGFVEHRREIAQLIRGVRAPSANSAKLSGRKSQGKRGKETPS